MSKFQSDSTEIRSTVKNTCEALWRKAGVDPYGANQSWTVEQLEDELAPWELNFLMAAMHKGVSDEAGWVQGLHLHFDDPDSGFYTHPDRVIDAWSRIGSDAMVRAIQFGLRRLFFLGYRKFEELSAGEWEQLEAQMDEEYGFGEPSVDDLLVEYARRHPNL